MKVEDIMSAAPVMARLDTTAHELAKMMRDNDIGAIPVVGADGKTAEGIVTDRDIVVRAVADRADLGGCKAKNVMTSPVEVVDVRADLDDVLKVMQDRQIRRVLVRSDKGAIIGIIAFADIARASGKRDTGKVVKDVTKPRAQA
jgi:CBS domain-containing protein